RGGPAGSAPSQLLCPSDDCVEGDRPRRDRTPAVEPAPPAALPPPSAAATSDLHNFRDRERKPVQLAAGIEPLRRVYDLRHTFATFAVSAGISTFDLSRSFAPA